jgi:hypothetical protein
MDAITQYSYNFHNKNTVSTTKNHGFLELRISIVISPYNHFLVLLEGTPVENRTICHE